jgi:hypothetical protein
LFEGLSMGHNYRVHFYRCPCTARASAKLEEVER